MAQEKPTTFIEALEQTKSVLYAQAHADDENSIAGALARVTGAGKKLTMVCFTQGENEPMDVGVAKGRPMAEARARWLQDSAKLLGAEAVQLPFTDGPVSVDELEKGVIAFWPREATPKDVIAQWSKIDRDPYEDMIRQIRRTKPEMILTWEITQGWTGNAEHRTVAYLAQKAFREAADPKVFPRQILEEGLAAHQPRWLFWVLRGQGDIFGPHPMENIHCDAPGPGNRTACQVRAAVMMSYKRHTMREATQAQLDEVAQRAGEWMKTNPEHVQLAVEASPSKALDK